MSRAAAKKEPRVPCAFPQRVLKLNEGCVEVGIKTGALMLVHLEESGRAYAISFSQGPGQRMHFYGGLNPDDKMLSHPYLGDYIGADLDMAVRQLLELIGAVTGLYWHRLERRDKYLIIWSLHASDPS